MSDLAFPAPRYIWSFTVSVKVSFPYLYRHHTRHRHKGTRSFIRDTFTVSRSNDIPCTCTWHAHSDQIMWTKRVDELRYREEYAPQHPHQLLCPRYAIARNASPTLLADPWKYTSSSSKPSPTLKPSPSVLFKDRRPCSTDSLTATS